MIRRGHILWLAAAVVAGPAAARDIHYGAVTDPALLDCDALAWHGESVGSRDCYAALLDGDTSSAVKAEAAWALNDLHLANQWFQRATAESPDDLMLRVRWGDLFADTHQNAEAMEIYREVLDDDPAHAFAQLGAARVLIDRFESAADTYLEALLTDPLVDDGARAAALLLRARVALENGDRDATEQAVAAAESITERNGWPPLEAWAIRAALDLLDGIEDSPWIQRSLAYNPGYGGIYATAAHYFVITRRYRDAIALYQKAVDLDPGLAQAQEQLGVNLLRDNQVSRARRHLEIAYAEDPFSPVAVNSLRLLDSFSNFRLVDDPPSAPGAVPITLRLHEDEAAPIAPYAVALVRDSIEVFSSRYNFGLEEPVVVEMYPDHEDFAVRTAGMPGLGILGATFGYVIAMDSPSSRPPEEFQWGTTLWHEMAHVFTLEVTNHLVPRWFSEGLSVFEEWESGPNPGVHIPLSVYVAMRDGLFLPIAGLDEGFIRPSYENQVIVSYMQAGLVCEFIAKRFGEDRLRAMLAAYRDGLDTPAVIEQALGMMPAAFDSAFADFVDETQGQALERLDEWQHGQAEIARLASEEDWEAVAERARELIGIIPAYVDPDSPYLALARAAEAAGNTDAAIETLTTFWHSGGYDPAALRKLARLLVDADRPQTAVEALTSVILVDPLDIDTHATLGDLLLDTGRPADALREYQVALELEPHDRAAAWYRLARAEHALGNLTASQDYLLQALDLAPSYRPAQRLLLQLAAEQTDD